MYNLYFLCVNYITKIYNNIYNHPVTISNDNENYDQLKVFTLYFLKGEIMKTKFVHLLVIVQNLSVDHVGLCEP